MKLKDRIALITGAGSGIGGPSPGASPTKAAWPHAGFA